MSCYTTNNNKKVHIEIIFSKGTESIKRLFVKFKHLNIVECSYSHLYSQAISTCTRSDYYYYTIHSITRTHTLSSVQYHITQKLDYKLINSSEESRDSSVTMKFNCKSILAPAVCSKMRWVC